jgi:hypothetical protein
MTQYDGRPEELASGPVVSSGLEADDKRNRMTCSVKRLSLSKTNNDSRERVCCL